MKVGVVTDNTSNLPSTFIKENNIGVVSLYVMKKGTFSKAVEMSSERYYEELKRLDYVPSTFQPSPLDFENVYIEMLKEYDVLISVHISEKLSGTVDSAKMAANTVGGRIYVVDSKLTSWGLGFLVMELVDLLKKDVKVEALVNFASTFHEKVSTYFTVNDLTHLYKGGRIGKARTLLARLLNARPLLKLRNGEILPAGTFRGKQRLLDALVKRAFSRVGSSRLRKVAIIHAGNVRDAAHLKSMVEKYVSGNGSRLFTDVCDVVIGTHLGSGAVGIITEWG